MLNKIDRDMLGYLARAEKPLWGAHLKRGEPLNDRSMKHWLAEGWIEAVGTEGYVITEKGKEAIAPIAHHTYPSHYRPGTHWATDEAWKILDAIHVGVLPDDVRFLLAGMIAGTLVRIAKEGAPDAKQNP